MFHFGHDITSDFYINSTIFRGVLEMDPYDELVSVNEMEPENNHTLVIVFPQRVSGTYGNQYSITIRDILITPITPVIIIPVH